MKNKKKATLWSVHDHEGRVLALAVAKTSGGAKKKWEDFTGLPRDDIHVEEIELEHGFCEFPAIC